MTRSELPGGDEFTGGDRYLTWDASYVLGALSSAERREYETHLQTCARCRAAVAELSGIPALLSLLDPDDVRALDDEPAETPPLRPELRETVLDRVKWRRRRSRWLTSATVGVAAALLAVGLVVGIRPEIVGLQPNSANTAAQELEMTKVAQTPINASITLSSHAWGTRIDMACTYGQWSGGPSDVAPQNLGMVVIGRDGTRSQIATWLGLSDATALPSGNTPMPKSDIAAVQLVSSDTGKVLLERTL